MKERKVVTVGKPSLKNLSKNESKVFYSTLLSAVVEYYKDNNDSNQCNFDSDKINKKMSANK